MKYILGFILAISISGCAITWTGVALAVGAGVSVAEDVAGVAKLYKDAKDYVLENNTTKG